MRVRRGTQCGCAGMRVRHGTQCGCAGGGVGALRVARARGGRRVVRRRRHVPNSRLLQANVSIPRKNPHTHRRKWLRERAPSG